MAVAKISSRVLISMPWNRFALGLLNFLLLLRLLLERLVRLDLRLEEEGDDCWTALLIPKSLA